MNENPDAQIARLRAAEIRKSIATGTHPDTGKPLDPERDLSAMEAELRAKVLDREADRITAAVRHEVGARLGGPSFARKLAKVKRLGIRLGTVTAS